MADNAKDIIAAAVKKMSEAVNYLEEDLKTYRAGKANPAVFNSVMVDYYGNPTPVPQVASITVPDARTMLIQPWEKNMIPKIEKAIMDANLGFTPQNNGEHIRINVPPLTEDRRKELVKKSKAAGESRLRRTVCLRIWSRTPRMTCRRRWTTSTRRSTPSLPTRKKR